jgi:Leucine-rich repeat (LRR) protein
VNENWWPVGGVKTCEMRNSTSIPGDGYKVYPRDESITGLDFDDNNKISFLPIKVHETFPNLLLYTASKCSLTKITKKNFEGLSKLKGLWLGTNQITTINDDTFEDLVSLKRLYLSKKIYFHISKFF